MAHRRNTGKAQRVLADIVSDSGDGVNPETSLKCAFRTDLFKGVGSLLNSSGDDADVTKLGW